MRTNPNSPLSSLLTKGVLVKTLVFLAGMHLLLDYINQQFQEIAPHTVKNTAELLYRSRDWASYDRKSQKLMVNQSREAVSKQNRTTFKFAILTPILKNNVQLYCSALEPIEARIAISNVIGQELKQAKHEFKQGQQVLELNVSDWVAGNYLLQIESDDYAATRNFEVNHEASARFASRP